MLVLHSFFGEAQLRQWNCLKRPNSHKAKFTFQDGECVRMFEGFSGIDSDWSALLTQYIQYCMVYLVIHCPLLYPHPKLLSLPWGKIPFRNILQHETWRRMTMSSCNVWVLILGTWLNPSNVWFCSSLMSPSKLIHVTKHLIYQAAENNPPFSAYQSSALWEKSQKFHIWNLFLDSEKAFDEANIFVQLSQCVDIC